MPATLSAPLAAVKRAAEAGNDFETAFANLAHAAIKDRAPSLLDYEIGFQVIDRDDTNNRAAGAFGFQVGDRWLYAPVVFNNGRLEGAEILILADENQFVPLEEGWLNAILRRKPPELGKPGKPPGFGKPRPTSPDLRVMTGRYKYGKVQKAFKTELTTLLEKPGEYIDLDLPTLTRADSKLAAAIANVLQHPQMQIAYDRFYGAGKAVKMAAAMPAQSVPVGVDQVPNQTPTPTSPAGPPAPTTGSGLPAQLIADGLGRLGGMMPPTPMGEPAPMAGPEPAPPTPSPFNAVAGGAAGASLPHATPEPSPGPWGQFQNWTDRNMDFLPQGLPGGRATALLGGLGLAAGAGAMVAGGGSRRRRRDRSYGDGTDDTSAEMMAKSGGVLSPEPVVLPPLDGEVEVRTRKSASALLDSEDVLTDLMLHGLSIRDTRQKTAEAVPVSRNIRFHSPTDSGVYEVMLEGGDTAKALVLTGHRGHPSSTGAEVCTVVWEDDSGYQNVMPAALAAVQANDFSAEDGLKRIFEGATTQDSWKPGDDDPATYVLIDERGRSAFPFRVYKAETDGDEARTFEVCFDDHACNAGLTRPHRGDPFIARFDHAYEFKTLHHLTLSGLPGWSLKVIGDRLVVPSNFKVVKVATKSQYENEPKMLGDRLDLATIMTMKSARLVVTDGSQGLNINGYPPADRNEAIRHLVVDWDLRQKSAETILADVKRHKKAEYDVLPPSTWDAWLNARPKTAAAQFPGFPDQREDTGWFGSSRSEQGLRRDIVRSPHEDPSTEPEDMDRDGDGTNSHMPVPSVQDPSFASNIMSAADSGRKEVFDASIITSALRASGDESLVDRYLGNLIKGVDNIGRILLGATYRPEVFSERYGEADLPELKDSLRRDFKNLGELVLFLKEKTVDPFPGALGGLGESVT